jgi:hypothetical protein
MKALAIYGSKAVHRAAICVCLTTIAERRASGGGITKASCPTFQKQVTVKTSYTKITSLQRLQQLAKSFGDQQSTQAYKLATSLVYAGEGKLDSGEARAMVWNGQVADVFDKNTLTVEEGVSTTISTQPTEFPIASGLEAKCNFIYSTVRLQIPFTATAAFLFDASGATSWVTSFPAQYEASSYTDIQTVVTFTKSSGQRGGCQCLLSFRPTLHCCLAPASLPAAL